MTGPNPPPLPIGDLDFFDNKTPGVFAGNYWITVTHAATVDGSTVNTDPLNAVQEFVVSAPQFTLKTDEIVSMHPPAASSGRFGEQLPHIVLREPALPWERLIDGGSTPIKPWLTLLVLTESEITGGGSSPTRTSTLSVQGFLAPAPDGKVFKPHAIREDDIDPTSTCNFIQLSTDVFTAVTPRLSELPFLAHCRQANIGDKAAQGLDPDGFFSIVLANRFPAAPPANADPTQSPATKNIVHLVSLEGLETLLCDAPDFGGCTSVALVSLASWVFQCQSDLPLDFRGLVENFVSSETVNGRVDVTRLALTLPQGDATADAAAADKEVRARLSRGFVPLAYHTRTGEDTFAWYRGPLAPTVTQPLDKTASGSFLTADAAMAYQPDYGVFDLSLAVAWEAGRAAALSDTAFGQRLLDFRRRTHQLTDQLLYRLESVYFFSQDQIATLSTDTAVEDEFLAALDWDLIHTIGSAASVAIQPPTSSDKAEDAPTDPKAGVSDFLGDPAVQEMLSALVSDDLAGIGQWLARLLLLYPLPFNLLVPDAQMLPPEAVRFFYIDNNWTDALLDGALSLGLESSRQTFFHMMTRDLLQQSAYGAARDLRASIIGTNPPSEDVEANVITGIVIRSALVSGWPTLAVRPYVTNTTMLRVLRMDRLSPTVLLCLFWGVPSWVEISEPQEGLQLGVDDDGNVTLRNLIAPVNDGGPALGAQIGAPLQVFDPKGQKQFCARGVGDRTLDIAALVSTIKTALSAAGGMPAGDLGPAQLAVQMVKAPEAIQFYSQTG